MDAEAIKQRVLESLGSLNIDETIVDYICGILEDEGIRSDEEECISVVSPLLQESVSSEEEAIDVCKKILSNLGSTSKQEKKSSILAQPIKVADSDLANLEDKPEWQKTHEKPTLVNKELMQNVEAKRERRLNLRQKREEFKKKEKYEKEGIPTDFTITRSEDSTNKSKDVRLENFSISLGKVVLLEDCNVTLAYGRRYGLVGRNGSGKSTLLKHISRREIDGIPGHLNILHVEQEVIGDDTSVIQSVLKADVEREQLLQSEKNILATPDDSTDTRSVQLKKIYDRLEEIDAHSAEARAASILSGLGFDAENQRRATKEFSGGWRMRISLARALFCHPDILLLDEPTNHLDLYSCLWLEDYLQNWKGTLLVVSHQRDFLNAVSTDILHLSPNRKIDAYKGNFDNFENVRYERMMQQQRTFDSQQKRVKHMQGFIDRFRYNAKRAALVQSRIKALEKLELVEEVMNDPTLVIRFRDPEELIPPILQFRDVTFKYEERALFSDVNLGIDLDSRVALVGANGTGKSTILKLMAGELEPTSGSILRHSKLRFAKFSQHFVEQLGDYNVSSLEHFMNVYPGIGMQESRSHLGSFGLSGDLALRSILALSGGQKSRLVFAILAWRNPHILLLDEPTNHLDIETIDSLCQALAAFKGGVLLVSHDERLISMVCDQLWYFKDGKVNVFDGEFSEYRKEILDQMRAEA